MPAIHERGMLRRVSHSFPVSSAVALPSAIWGTSDVPRVARSELRRRYRGRITGGNARLQQYLRLLIEPPLPVIVPLPTF